MDARRVLRPAMVFLVVSGIVIGAAQSLQAQANPEQLALDVANAQKLNQAALTRYSWRVKSTIAKDGETMATSLSEMRFNTAGDIESTNVGGESFVEKKRGLRGRAQEHEIDDFTKYLEGLLQHAFKYIFMSKGTLVDVFDRAQIDASDSSITISAGALFVEGDEWHLAVDPKTKLPTKLSFTTKYGDDTVNGSVTLGVIEDGPSKPVSLEFDIPTQSVKITSETYDWMEQK